MPSLFRRWNWVISIYAYPHTLAASNNDGLLEVDANPNPLRSELVGDMLSIKKGFAILSHKPGLGIDPKNNEFKSYLVSKN